MLADTLPALLQRLDPRGARLWGPGLVRAMLRAEQPDPARPVHLYVCIADHFEPRWRRPSVDEERARVARWERDYPALADRHRDSDGRPHVRTLFFPAEEYRPEHLDALVRLKDKGLVDVELHLHHDHDTRDNLRTTLTDFAALLHREHGCLRRDAATGQVRYAFIHGNWALDNGHGGGEFCGVDDELSVLVETGCYLDMTMPCVPSPAQSRIVNEIYYARSAPGRSRGYDRGRTVHVGGAARPGELMLIPGPLGVLLGSRVKGLVPRIEAAMLEPENPVPAPPARGVVDGPRAHRPRRAQPPLRQAARPRVQRRRARLVSHPRRALRAPPRHARSPLPRRRGAAPLRHRPTRCTRPSNRSKTAPGSTERRAR
jgi:hypothetical protein